MINLRHHINHPILGTWGGHCGYSVRPSERGKGYAKEMLRLNLQNARAMGIEKLLRKQTSQEAVWTDPGNGDIPGSAKSKRQDNTSPPCAITKPCPSSMGDPLWELPSAGDSQRAECVSTRLL